MLRKEILVKNNILYNNEYVPAEDYALWSDLINYTKFEVLEDKLVKYRFYNENTSSKQKSEQRKKTTAIQLNTIEKHHQY